MEVLTAVEIEHLPVIVKFVLHSIMPTNAQEVIAELRSKLDFPVSLPRSQENKIPKAGATDCEGLVLDVVRVAVRFQRTTAEAWLRVIETLTDDSQHKPIDLLVLFILHVNHHKQVESMFKSKVRLGRLKDSLLQSVFSRHASVLRNTFPAILATAQTLLRSMEPVVSIFGARLCCLAFCSFDSYCKQEVLGALVMHVCSGSTSETDAALDALQILARDHPADLSPFAVFIKGILDYLDSLDLGQIRRVFTVLTSLTSDPHPHIQDELHIVVRKQLSSATTKYKRIGIIAALVLVKMSSSCRGTQEECSDASELDDEVFKQVTSLLDLVRSCIERTPDAAALYFDELANLIQSNNLHTRLQTWIGENALSDFQDIYVVDVGVGGQMPSEGLPLRAKLCYNIEEEDNEGSIALNLLPLLSEAQAQGANPKTQLGAKRSASLLCMMPHFRLLWLSEKSLNEGKLETIDGLLSCPLYTADYDLIEGVDLLPRADREMLCTLLFFTLNWFRELLNAFSWQQDADMRSRVLCRLHNITEVQALLETCLTATQGYVPPAAHFDSNVGETAASTSTSSASAPKAIRKGKKSKVEVHNISTDSSQSEENAAEVWTNKTQKDKDVVDKDPGPVQLSAFRAYLRELDLETFDLLRAWPMSRTLLDPSQSSHTAAEVAQLGPKELVFLLNDLTAKLDHILIAPKRNLFRKAVQEKNDGIIDGPQVNVEEFEMTATCYQLLLRVLLALFSWGGFVQPENRSLFRSALSILAGRLQPGQASQNLDHLLGPTFSYLQVFAKTLPSCSSAVMLVNILVALGERTSTPHLSCSKTAAVALGFLKQVWLAPTGQRESGTKYNKALDSLLRVYLDYCEDVFAVIEDIAEKAVPEIIHADKDSSSPSYSTLTRLTFSIFFRAMFAALQKALKGIPGEKASDSSEEQLNKILTWNVAVQNFHRLVKLVKIFDGRTFLFTTLKYGRLFVETFQKQGMPLLDLSFKKHKNEVHNLLKSLQQSTRQLHHMCGHSKVRQDTGLTQHVPQLKRSMEALLYRVKASLALNHCPEAFWLGNLKNRDLQGEEISSQVAMAENTEGASEEPFQLLDDDIREGDNASESDPPGVVSSDESCSEEF
uniref:Fanconi anemia group D2 protein n=1 Tax=Eptatretus burgeri TaxID=7764 RepID=A0A8C4X1H2_EPTBU